MKILMRSILAMAVLVLCQYGHAAGYATGESQIVKVLKAGNKTKVLEGAALKVARPILKKTPVSVVIDNIRTMIICPLELEKKDMQELDAEAVNILCNYMMVREINDELSHLFTYIDNPENGRFSELILYNKRPQTSIMMFVGDFTIEDLMKIGELSVQDRKDRIRDRHKNN